MRPNATVFMLFLGMALFATGSLRSEEPLPEGKGKEVVETMCVSCHGLDTVTQRRKTREEWQIVVDEMVSNGAPLLPREVEIVVQYLAEHFAPAASSKGDSKAAE